jgi:hypothetical protein
MAEIFKVKTYLRPIFQDDGDDPACGSGMRIRIRSEQNLQHSNFASFSVFDQDKLSAVKRCDMLNSHTGEKKNVGQDCAGYHLSAN